MRTADAYNTNSQDEVNQQRVMPWLSIRDVRPVSSNSHVRTAQTIGPAIGSDVEDPVVEVEETTNTLPIDLEYGAEVLSDLPTGGEDCLHSWEGLGEHFPEL